MPYQILPSIGKDPAIKDLSQNSIPGHPPAGYRPLLPGENNQEIGAVASIILRSSTLGDQTPFILNGKKYMARTEPHFHPPPPKGTDPSEFHKFPKPWGWHKGVTVFKAKEEQPQASSEGFNPPEPSSSQARLKLLQRVHDTPDANLKSVDDFFSELDKEI
jgi:hypothetical protein